MNNIKALLKVFHKHKSYTAINIFGLSVGFALIMVIILLLRFDLNYDKHWSESDKIFRIDSKFLQENSEDQLALASKFLPERLLATIPEVTGYARFSRPRKISVKTNNKLFNESQLIYSDNASLNLFKLDFIVGNENQVLNAPFELIIDDELAVKWFGQVNSALDEVILIKNKYFTIKGVYKALPENTHLYFKGLMSYASLMGDYDLENANAMDQRIWVPDAYSFLLLQDEEQKDAVQQKIQSYIDQNIKPIIEESGSSERLEPLLIPLEETHFYIGSDYDQPKGNMAFIKATVIIGFIILLIVSINYSNLAMSILAQRNKELSMRRLLGATRWHVSLQIIFESMLSVFFSFLLALVWLFILDQSLALETLVGRKVDLLTILTFDYLFYWIGAIMFIALFSSWYPAIVYSKASILHIKEHKKENQTITSLMIGVQFVASFMVISSMLLMKSQLSLLENFDIGITEEPIISVEVGQTSSPDQVKLVKERLSVEPGIELVTDAVLEGGNLVGVYHVNANIMKSNDEFTETVFAASFVGEDYCNVFDIDLLEGRKFNQTSEDAKSVMVNKKFAERYFPKGAIGEAISFRKNTFNIIGVIDNFYYRSLREDLEPMAIFPRYVFTNDEEESVETSFQIRISDQNQKLTLTRIKNVFAQTYPNFPFSYRLISDKVNAFYEEDQKDADLTAVLGMSAILIAVFGLVGLVSFEINQRIKELSIRKVLGAKPQTLFFIIGKKQMILLFLACLISVPATYFFISNWLNEFNFTIDLSLSLAISTFLSLMIVLILVGAAMTMKFIELIKINPVKTLRHD